MAYTSADLTAVESAIIALGKGERAIRVTIRDKTIEYTKTDLTTLEQLRGRIQRDIAIAAGGTRYRYITTSKGY